MLFSKEHLEHEAKIMFLNESDVNEAIPVYGVEELSFEQALQLLDADHAGKENLRTEVTQKSCPASLMSRQL